MIKNDPFAGLALSGPSMSNPSLAGLCFSSQRATKPFATLGALAFALLAAPAHAQPPDPGTEDWALMHEFKDWVVSQHAENGQWCCDLGDGRPLRDDEIRFISGHYQILYARRHWNDGTDAWIDVPIAALMRIPNPLGMPVAWVIHGHVFCLSLSGAV